MVRGARGAGALSQAGRGDLGVAASRREGEHRVTRVIAIADSDSYLKWSVATLGRLPSAYTTRQLVIANPVLIWAVVAGAHNEALSVMFAVAGLLFMRKNPFVAGLGIGLAGSVKLSIGLWGLAMLWAYRRQPVKAWATMGR